MPPNFCHAFTYIHLCTCGIRYILFLLYTVDEEILSLQHSTTMLKSLCSKITVLNVDLPVCQDDLHYCKLICKADPVLHNKVSSFYMYTLS